LTKNESSDREDLSKWSLASRNYYDSLEDEFKEANEYWENPYDTETWKMENDLTSEYLKQEGLLLDLGVGFYPHVESTEEKNLVCLDISGRSLVVAQREYGPRNKNTEFICADAMRLPFPDATFGGIIAGGELVNHMPGYALLKETHRALQPGGKLILSVGMKWCLDSIYAILDAIIAHRIGYSMTRSEAVEFLRRPQSSTQVTWEVTPKLDLRVTLYSKKDIEKTILETGFRVVKTRSLNLLSAIIPLPIQQDARISGMLRTAIKFLLYLDRGLGRIPGLKWFAGNLFMVLEKR
jgi:ubiquinone/menaquinone biosynthesis C-methylase UbiE